ncbi:MAG: tetratricopeptide repeat protein [Blastocatellia bacterium]|nr:tetratricopeptide repeat protein [Blastocatellia bacterium]
MKSTNLFASIAMVSVLLSTPVSAQQKPKSTPPADTQKGDQPSAREQRMRAYMLFLQGREYENQGEFQRAINTYKEVIQLDGQAAAPHIALGEIYFQNQNSREAENEARKAVTLDKENPAAHRLLGNVLTTQALSRVIDKEKVQEAITQFQEVVRLEKNDPDAYRTLGRLYLAANDVDSALDSFQKLLGSGFAGLQEYRIVSRIYFDKGRYRDAAHTARQAYLMSDKNLDLAVMLAQSLVRSGQTTEALEVYQDVLPENSNNAGLVLEYSETLMRAGKYQPAAAEAQKILDLDPNNVAALSVLAQVQRRSGKREEAVKILQQALKGQDVTESLQLQFELAETLIELNRIDEGVGAYQTALKALVNPDGTIRERDQRNAGIILRRIAAAYKAGGKREKVFETFEYMRKVLGAKSTLPDTLTVDFLRDETKYGEALKIARDAQVRYPEERQFKYFEAQLLQKIGELDKAVTLLQKMVTNTPEDGEIYVTLASLQMEGNRHDDAEQTVRKALQYDEKNIDYLLLLSSIQDRKKQFKESEETLRRVLALDPDNPTAMNNLGYFLSERNIKLEEAQALIQRAVNIEPTNSSFLDSLGWVFFKKNQFETAKQYIEQALGYDNRSATLNDHLGDVYHKLGKLDQARKYWQKAMELSSEREDVARIKTKLQAAETGQR